MASRRPRKKRPAVERVSHTSQPTSRAAYQETRVWLLKTHGHICAYCGKTYPAKELTLDHVTPRRGQSAYDRRNNLVLACKACNAAKADKPFLAWVIGNKTRAKHLWVYGQHLSDGILDILRPMVGDIPVPAPKPETPARPKRHVYGLRHHADDSPYLDDAPAASRSRDGAEKTTPGSGRGGARRGGGRRRRP